MNKQFVRLCVMCARREQMKAKEIELETEMKAENIHFSH